MFKLHFNFIHIGDQIATTAMPENIFHATGQRCAITDSRIWAFKHNPYVDFIDETAAAKLYSINLIPDCRVPEQAQSYARHHQLAVTTGQADYMLHQLGIHEPVLRHSRLYVYENLAQEPDKVVVHTQGSDRTRDGEPAIRYSSGEDSLRVFTDEIIEAVLENYKNYRIVQVGAETDRALGGHSIDLRGKTDYWGTAREIATAARFIGVNSGPMHIANCYPRVDKRIVLTEFSQRTLYTYRPADVRNWLFSWVDPTNTFFNRTEHDIGLTYSYTKI